MFRISNKMSGNQRSEESSKSKSIDFLPVEIIPIILFPYFSSAFLTNSGISGIRLRFLFLSSSENSDPKIPNGSWKELPLDKPIDLKKSRRSGIECLV